MSFCGDRCFQNKSLHRAIQVALLTSVFGLSGCETTGSSFSKPTSDVNSHSQTQFDPYGISPAVSNLAASVPKSKLTNMTRRLAFEGIKALDAKDYKKASALFNLALKADINNSGLHFMNAYTYHLRALGGEGSLYDLAQQGYKMAIQFDASNTSARKYLGLLELDRRNYVAARKEFMEAAIYSPEDKDLLYDLAVSAYYAKDPQTAFAALQGLKALEGANISKRTLRASAIVSAAIGDKSSADNYLLQFNKRDAYQAEQNYVSQRVNTWSNLYENGFVKANFPTEDEINSFQNPTSSGVQVSQITQASSEDNGFEESSKKGFYEKDMVNLEVVIISAEEDNNDTFGVNLLDGLKIQFGSSLGAAGYNSTTTRVKPDGGDWATTKSVTNVIQVPGITYTLNIANAEDRRNEVLAKPSLVAMAGKSSTFFTGTDVIGAAVATGDGGSVQVQKEAGVKLMVKPEFLPDDYINLEIEAERTFLTNPNSNVLFDFRLDTSKTMVKANVVMKFGETLILSGLSERNVESDFSGVPFLRDVPLVQYLFSTKTKRDFRKSVLIMVTPRHPDYTNRNMDDIKAEEAKMTEFEKVQNEFAGRYQQWYRPIPTIATVVGMLETSPLFREFRSGDVIIESWTSRTTQEGRLKEALKFLYY